MKKKVCEESVGKQSYVGQEEKKKLINKVHPKTGRLEAVVPRKLRTAGAGSDRSKGKQGPMRGTHNTYQEARL